MVFINPRTLRKKYRKFRKSIERIYEIIIYNYFYHGNSLIKTLIFNNITDPYVVAWKRGIAILTAGSVKVTPDPRVRLVNGFNLQIRDAVPQDAGDYICQIATMEPREITHTVEILGENNPEKVTDAAESV
uniref:Ig-like domain-containing protein n=1 Tax=Glossina pallidipes TaxID=7398 RepID=A0A1A9Z799_GLOPL